MPSKAEKRLKRAFGDALRRQRLALGLSQEKLAELADIHRTYIGDVERGLRNIALVNMRKLSKAMDVPLSALFAEMEQQERLEGTNG